MSCGNQYECALVSYDPYFIGVKRDSTLFRGSKCIPLMWIRKNLDVDDWRLTKPVGLCTHVAFERPECVPCCTIPLDVARKSPVMVESTNRYSVLCRDRCINCGICNHYPM